MIITEINFWFQPYNSANTEKNRPRDQCYLRLKLKKSSEKLEKQWQTTGSPTLAD